MNDRHKIVNTQRARRHTERGCSWPGCTRTVPAYLWGCKPHWFALPKEIRDRIWAAYRPGQETDLNLSEAYRIAFREAQEWIARELQSRARKPELPLFPEGK